MSDMIFHLAFPVEDIAKAREFYCDGLGCTLGRHNSHSLILGLGGHQLVAHQTGEKSEYQPGIYPRHFGLICKSEVEWQSLCDRAKAKGLMFRAEPKVRFAGTPLEHNTFFLEDPSNNLLEFKYYRHPSAIFGEHDMTKVGDR